MIFSFSQRRIFLFVLLFLMSVGRTFAADFIKEATYYSDAFEGGRTANGDLFEQKTYSAALCDIPLGQFLYVSKGNTGIVVDLNDRPNCSRNAHSIDLSREAFRQFAPLSTGRIRDVQITSLGPAPTDRPKTFLAPDTFQHLGIILTNQIPTIFFSGEGIDIRGKVLSGNSNVLIFASGITSNLLPPSSILVKVKSDKTFQGFLPLPNSTGDIIFVVASGDSFDTDKYASLSLISRSSLTYPKLPEKSRARITPKIVYSSTSDPLIRLPSGIYGELEIRQGKRVYTSVGKNFLLKDIPLTFGRAQVKIAGYGLSTDSSLDRGVFYPNLFSGSVILERSHGTIGRDSVIIQVKNNSAKFRFKSPSAYKVRGKYYLTSPKGEVKEISFSRSYLSGDGFLKQGMMMSGSIVLDTVGTYMLEIVREDGIAYANIPITYGNTWPIIDVLTPSEISTLRTDSALVKRSTIDRINVLRNSLGKYSVKEDSTLTALAQAKVDDMIKRGYQGHMDPDGNYIDSLALKLNLDTGGSIGENIGYGTVSDLSLQDGLEESGVHRLNMLQDNWTRVGIGYGISEGKVYLVHIFSE